MLVNPSTFPFACPICTLAAQDELMMKFSRWSLCMLLAALLCFAMPALGQETQPADPLAEQMSRLEAATTRLRGLEPLFEITRAFPTREETIVYLTAALDRDLPPDYIARITDFYVALNLLPADIDLKATLLGLLGSQVAGFYDPDTRTMNVIPLTGNSVGARLGLLEQTIYVHEYVHALQDMHFGLDALLPDDLIQAHPDRALAITSLVEGDATAVMQVYLQRAASANPIAAVALLAEGAAAGALTIPEGVPDILTRELLFPYEQGLIFVTALYNAGEWAAVDAAFADPPRSSAQILRPALYLNGVQPIDVAPPPVSPGEGWETLWETTLGEFYLREHVRTLTSTPADAVRAASGWAGDSFQMWRSLDGALAFLLSMRFEDAAEADEFAAVYQEGVGAFAEGCALLGEMVLCAAQAQDAVVIAGAPSQAMAAELLRGAR
jgi:hypothetical protein